MACTAENDESPIAWNPRAAGEEKATDMILEMQGPLGEDIVPATEGMIEALAAALAVRTTSEHAAAKLMMVAHAIIRTDVKRRAAMN